MGWTSPATGVVGTLLTAALWNTNLRDNLLWLSSPDRCRTYMTAGQSITANTNTAVKWTSTDTYDTNNLHSTTTNPTRITIATKGLYAIAANVWFPAISSGYFMQIGLQKNGTSLGIYNQVPTSGGAQAISCYDEISCNAGDYIECWVQHNYSSAVTINSVVGDQAYMTARWAATS